MFKYSYVNFLYTVYFFFGLAVLIKADPAKNR